MAGRWFSPGSPVSSTNKTDRHDNTEILIKVALNTIYQSERFYFKLILLNISVEKKGGGGQVRDNDFNEI